MVTLRLSGQGVARGGRLWRMVSFCEMHRGFSMYHTSPWLGPRWIVPLHAGLWGIVELRPWRRHEPADFSISEGWDPQQ